MFLRPLCYYGFLGKCNSFKTSYYTGYYEFGFSHAYLLLLILAIGFLILSAIFIKTPRGFKKNRLFFALTLPLLCFFVEGRMEQPVKEKGLEKYQEKIKLNCCLGEAITPWGVYGFSKNSLFCSRIRYTENNFATHCEFGINYYDKYKK